MAGKYKATQEKANICGGKFRFGELRIKNF
jgi:hypothetical protein